MQVPSSRQDILGDSVWNQYLLNEIPSLFLSSLDAFHHERSSLTLDPLRLFLHFLPNEASIYQHHLFTPVCRTILRSLRARSFLPVMTDASLRMPTECVLIDDPSIKELITPELLFTHLQLHYLHEDLYEFRQPLYELGVHRIGPHELMDLIQRILTSDVRLDNTVLLCKWFCCLYRCLNQLALADEEKVFKHLRCLKIFPVKNRDEWMSLESTDRTVFFPSVHMRLPQVIENDLLIIDEQLWAHLEENTMDRMQIQTLLERLGVQRLTARMICDEHIFSVFESEEKYREKSLDVLIAYVMFVFDLWSKQVGRNSI